MESPIPREVKIQAALKELSEGKMTYAEASKAYGVGVGTLHGRMHGAKPQRQAHKAVQKLSPALEESIVHWILFEKLANRPPAKVMVHRYAQHVCDLSGIQTTLGRHWVDRFYFRHPEVNIKVTLEPAFDVFVLHTTQAVKKAEPWGPLHRACGAMPIYLTKAPCATDNCSPFGGVQVALNACQPSHGIRICHDTNALIHTKAHLITFISTNEV
ncbi:hypothetical protein J7T55_008234 [Diaporthe amygdali]|uniref:uncharacterized protein n=1 Tax=Phomopsis amygdali TaxID=1214568 RepID=UPI0022FE1C0E|nr:uncharacterized protein J7T55_008234 [Diaporthe amygdali]KAJ0121074.1 hypothetical protein J7T55_008234 [Diaporthe amygdali]